MATIHLGESLPTRSSGIPGRFWAGSPPPTLPCSRWGLPSRSGRPERWCALTAPFHPYRTASPEASRRGGLFSVALSCESPRLGVTQHPALWSPDVPRTGNPARGRLVSSPRTTALQTVRRVGDSGGNMAYAVCSAATGPLRCRKPVCLALRNRTICRLQLDLSASLFPVGRRCAGRVGQTSRRSGRVRPRTAIGRTRR